MSLLSINHACRFCQSITHVAIVNQSRMSLRSINTRLCNQTLAHSLTSYFFASHLYTLQGLSLLKFGRQGKPKARLVAALPDTPHLVWCESDKELRRVAQTLRNDAAATAAAAAAASAAAAAVVAFAASASNATPTKGRAKKKKRSTKRR
jgi:hypothetical protein